MANVDPPPADTAAGGSSGTSEAETLAARIGIKLPPECASGVCHQVALLDRHWSNLRSFVPPPA